MKEDIAKKWVKALRSGKYKQCQKRLYDGEGYCCLGVLCKILGKEFKLMENCYAVVDDNENYFIGLPDSVRKFVGLSGLSENILANMR